MIKVVIADDEKHIGRLIETLVPWEEMGMKPVGFAANGLEALELLKKENPDILITDIRMPGCNGLELIEQARTVCKQLQIVVISGYANFEYAQSALRVGVRDYLLKPINKEELCDTMRKLKAKIEEERLEAELHADSRETQKKDVSKLRQLLVERLLDEQGTRIGAEILKEQYHFSVQPGFFVGFCLRTDVRKNEGHDPILDVYEERMTQIFDSCLSRCCYDWSYYRHHFSIYGIINFAEDRLDDVKKVLRDGLNQMNAQNYLFGDVVFTLGVGSYEQGPEHLWDSLQHAKRAAKERLLRGNGKVIEYEEKNPVLYERKLLDQYSREMNHVLEVLSVEELARANDWFSHAVMETKGLQGYELYDIVLEAGNLFIVRLNLQNKADMVKKFRMACDFCADAEQLFASLHQFEKDLLEERMESYEQDSTRPVRQAKQYIQNHFQEQISLEEVSELVGFSSAYFSVLFKKETGLGFAKYLMQVRMEQAKVLLRETNLPVAEICKKVGYNDLKYFTQTFEKIAGVKPSVFRKLYG